MIRRSLTLFAVAALVAGVQPLTVAAQESRPSTSYPDDFELYNADQLDNLVGAIALYPDALLAQVLVAATFPDQIEEAARFVRANGTSDIDDQAWDVSVKAVAHYPSALNMMADKIDWTTTLGRAYASQSSEVMAAVQRMRAMADAQGNLQSTAQQNIVHDDENYVIAPMNPRVIYVPVYDPYVVYTRPVYQFGYQSAFWSFGVGFPIGGWLSYDCNWRSRSVYYNGWDRAYYGYAGGWRGRSAPYIHISNVYVNSRYRNVYINRDVIRRRVEYRNVDRYQGVHRDTRFGSHDVDYRDGRNQARDRSRTGGYGYGDRSRGTEGRTYNGGDRGNDSRTRNDDGRSVGDGRGGSVGGTENDRGRTVGDGRGGSIGGADNDRGRTIGDGRGGSIGGADNNRGGQGRDRQRADAGSVSGNDNRGGWGRDRQRDDAGNRDAGNRDAGSRDRGAAAPQSRGPLQRNEQPMVNPRRAESQPARSGDGGNRDGGNRDGGNRGGSRNGGGDRGGRERPKF